MTGRTVSMVLVASLVFAACSGASSADGEAGTSPGGAQASNDDGSAVTTTPRVVLTPAPAPAFTGLYLPYEVDGSGGTLSVVLSTYLSCSDLTAILGAGEWVVTDTTVVPGMAPMPDLGFAGSAEITYVALRGPGGQQAFGPVEPTADGGCRANIARLPILPVAVSGSVDLDIDAPALQFSCELTESSAIVSVVYLTAEAVVMVTLDVPKTPGPHDLAGGEPPSMEITTPGMTLAGLMASLGGGGDQEGSGDSYEAGADWSGTASVTGTETLLIDYSVTGLFSYDGTATAVSGSTYCDPKGMFPIPALTG